MMPIGIEIGSVANQNSGESYQAVKHGHEFRHLGHLHAAGEDKAHRPADHEGPDENGVVPGDSGDCGNQGDCHAQHTVEISPARGFLVTQSPEGKNEEDDCSEIGGVCKLLSHVVLRLEAIPCGTFPACAG